MSKKRTPDDLLAHKDMSHYIRKQKLLLKLVKTKLGKALLGKKLFMHEDLLKQKDELLNNLFGDHLDRVDSRYIDAMFLSYSKRQNKSKNPDDLCIKKIYEYSSKKLHKNAFDITEMQVDIGADGENIFVSLQEYLNVLENIRAEFKIWNSYYEERVKREFKASEEEDIFTEYQEKSPIDDIRNKKIVLCKRAYTDFLEKEDLLDSLSFSELCHLFYITFRASLHLSDLQQKLTFSGSDRTFAVDDLLFSKENQRIPSISVSEKNLFAIFQKLLKENASTLNLRNMYDIT